MGLFDVARNVALRLARGEGLPPLSDAPPEPPPEPPPPRPPELSQPEPSSPEPSPPPPDHGPFVAAAFARILHRPPNAEEAEHFAAVTGHHGHAELLRMLFDSNERRHRHGVDEASEFYAGHFYSPVIDPEALRAQGFAVDRQAPAATIHGVDLRPDEMVDFWRRNLDLILAGRFPAEPAKGVRYYTGNDLYSAGDAAILLAMLSEHRPRRIVEVGSGFSSACMLDIAGLIALPTRFTFIEPYPARLLGLLSEADRARCEIVESFVQQADLGLFEALEAGDILFIDSTHVSKAGSDVNYELFEILPRLRPGVVVHFHDCFWPFEYPDAWIFESRRSWNELYLLRAFLTGNRDFEVLFFNDYFRALHPEESALAPAFDENPGGGLWLRRTGQTPAS